MMSVALTEVGAAGFKKVGTAPPPGDLVQPLQ